MIIQLTPQRMTLNENPISSHPPQNTHAVKSHNQTPLQKRFLRYQKTSLQGREEGHNDEDAMIVDSETSRSIEFLGESLKVISLSDTSTTEKNNEVMEKKQLKSLSNALSALSRMVQ